MQMDIESLLENGYTTIQIMACDEMRERFREAFIMSTQTFPEYRRHDKNGSLTPDGVLYGERHSNFVMGGFGAFANPASFHNPYVRTLRVLLHGKVVPLFSDYLKRRTSEYDPTSPEFPESAEGFHLEQLFDRMCLRPVGSSIGREQWHRDHNPTAMPGDIVFGGWLNLDATPQYFSCSPATHHDKTVSKKRGFDREAVNPANQVLVEIPPGHLLVFYQNLLHEVRPGHQRHAASFRQYVCWRLTTHAGSTLQKDAIQEIVETQAVPRLPSNQIPPMYGANHVSFHLHKDNGPIRWSERILQPACTSIMHNGKLQIGHRYMKSLAEYGFQKYPRYLETETTIMTPHHSWILPDPSTFEWTCHNIQSLAFLHHDKTLQLHLV